MFITHTRLASSCGCGGETSGDPTTPSSSHGHVTNEKQTNKVLTGPSPSPSKVQKLQRRKSSSISASTLKALSDGSTMDFTRPQSVGDSSDIFPTTRTKSERGDTNDSEQDSTRFASTHSSQINHYASTPSVSQQRPSSEASKAWSTPNSQISSPPSRAPSTTTFSSLEPMDQSVDSSNVAWESGWPENDDLGNNGHPRHRQSIQVASGQSCCNPGTAQQPSPKNAQSSCCSKNSNQRAADVSQLSSVHHPAQDSGSEHTARPRPLNQDSRFQSDVLPDGAFLLGRSSDHSKSLAGSPLSNNSADKPLTSEELAIVRQNPAMFRSVIKSLALAGVLKKASQSESSTRSGPAHNCHCGDDCNCLGCAAHPFNQATMDYVRNLSAVQEDGDDIGSAGPPLVERPPHAGGVRGQHQFQGRAQRSLQATQAVQESPQSYAHTLGSFAGLENFPDYYPQAEPEEQPLSSSEFFHIDYPISCAEKDGHCYCGDNCTCEGCTVHGNQSQMMQGHPSLSSSAQFPTAFGPDETQQNLSAVTTGLPDTYMSNMFVPHPIMNINETL
ncbi:MAG: hypothetical protein M4579_005360 [Chaenotheca gracillima]|nr:MAG: hypothetical protein M4579_005360 [Chaenotheca gracillima]